MSKAFLKNTTTITSPPPPNTQHPTPNTHTHTKNPEGWIIQSKVYAKYKSIYRKTTNISHSLVGNKIVDHSDVVSTTPVGPALATCSFSTNHLASISWAKTSPRRDEKHFSLWIWLVDGSGQDYDNLFGIYLCPMCDTAIFLKFPWFFMFSISMSNMLSTSIRF